MSSLRSSFLLMLVLTVLLGVAYPLSVFAVAQTLFNHRANGSLIERGGKVMGSSLLGQSFESPSYFWGRLSATTPAYNPSASAGSNLSPGNPKLPDAVNARVAALHKADPENKALIPVDLVTASASGLDPHISVASARYQLHRVAKARGMQESAIQALLEKSMESPVFGLLQDPYVNIIKLNMWLDEATKESSKEKR
jgi:K+-transporting ATPase ATPase C chain